MIERRKYRRHKAHIVIKYKRLEDPLSRWQENSQVKNISLGGMFFSAFEKLSPSTMLLFNMQVYAEDSIVKVIELRGRVVGSEDGIISYDTRVAFVDIDKKTEKDLRLFMRYLS